MENQSFKETIKNLLIESAKKYQFLVKTKIEITSDGFAMKKTYVIRFYETNFLHLTGVKTTLSSFDFYKACCGGTIRLEDFDCDSSKELKGIIRKKMKNLVNIDSFFKSAIEVQEDFKKNSIKCLLGASDNKCTIGFANAKYCVRPQTILDKNHLDKEKPIIIVRPVIKELI